MHTRSAYSVVFRQYSANLWKVSHDTSSLEQASLLYTIRVVCKNSHAFKTGIGC